MNPKVSICIPAFQAEKYLPEALASVRSQSFTDWELIVTEDGSQDGTEALVAEFARSVSQPVRFQRHARNKGLSATRNSGFGAARADWIALLDADDIWRPEHLDALLDCREGSQANFLFSGCRLFSSDTGSTLDTREASAEICKGIGPALYAGKVIIQPSTVMFHRQVLEKIGIFDVGFSICNDLEFWLRAAEAEIHFGYSGKITCDYRKHSQAMSMKSADLIAEAAAICRRYRNLRAIPSADRRLVPAQHFLNAARIAARQRPLLAARWAVSSAWCRVGL